MNWYGHGSPHNDEVVLKGGVFVLTGTVLKPLQQHG